MEQLRVTLLQTDIAWKDKDKNFSNFSAHMAKLKSKTDLVVMPEMFSTGFSTDTAELSETHDGATLNWMKAQANQIDAVVSGSFIFEDNGTVVNRFFFAFPNGKTEHYDKRHLFRMGGEHDHFGQGSVRTVVEIKGWRIRPLVCYDLRFPVWARYQNDYDVLVYTANWPSKRMAHWQTLLNARAIENQAYTVGVNRLGSDGNGYDYTGDSIVFDPLGIKISGESHNKVFTETILLEKAPLEKLRNGFPVFKDADGFEIRD